MERSEHAAAGLQRSQGSPSSRPSGDRRALCPGTDDSRASALSAGGTGQVLPVCSAESPESLQPFLLPQQRPGEPWSQGRPPVCPRRKAQALILPLLFSGDEQLGLRLQADERLLLVGVPLYLRLEPQTLWGFFFLRSVFPVLPVSMRWISRWGRSCCRPTRSRLVCRDTLLGWAEPLGGPNPPAVSSGADPGSR